MKRRRRGCGRVVVEFETIKVSVRRPDVLEVRESSGWVLVWWLVVFGVLRSGTRSSEASSKKRHRFFGNLTSDRWLGPQSLSLSYRNNSSHPSADSSTYHMSSLTLLRQERRISGCDCLSSNKGKRANGSSSKHRSAFFSVGRPRGYLPRQSQAELGGERVSFRNVGFPLLSFFGHEFGSWLTCTTKPQRYT